MIQILQTFQAILENLPVEISITKWGDELYTDSTSIVSNEENARREVDYLDVAYWPEGNALCLFYGPTPISRWTDTCLFACKSSGKIIPQHDDKKELLQKIKDNTRVIFVLEE